MTLPKLVILDAYTTNPGDLNWEAFSAIADWSIYKRTRPQDVVSRAEGAEILITNKVKLTREVLEQLPDCKYISILATGTNSVDLEAANECGIKVSNVSGYSTMGVAQHTFALILHYYNQVHKYDRSVKEGQWNNAKDFTYYLHSMKDLSSRTLGILGFGEVGKAVGKIANAFGMEVLVHRKRKKPFDDFAINYVSFDELLDRSHVLSLNAPLTEETFHIINKKTLKQMRRDALLVNTSRGGLINEKDLKTALENRDIAAAAVDVIEEEPPSEFPEIAKAPQIAITPHIAWSSMESRERLINATLENVKGYLSGSYKNLVN